VEKGIAGVEVSGEEDAMAMPMGKQMVKILKMGNGTAM
jgi:hypothetical protein